MALFALPYLAAQSLGAGKLPFGQGLLAAGEYSQCAIAAANGEHRRQSIRCGSDAIEIFAVGSQGAEAGEISSQPPRRLYVGCAVRTDYFAVEIAGAHGAPYQRADILLETHQQQLVIL